MSTKNAVLYLTWLTSLVVALGIGYVLSTNTIKEAVKQEVASQLSVISETNNTKPVTTESGTDTLPPASTVPTVAPQEKTVSGGITSVGQSSIKILSSDGKAYTVLFNAETKFVREWSPDSKHEPGPPTGSASELEKGFFVVATTDNDATKDRAFLASLIRYSSDDILR